MSCIVEELVAALEDDVVCASCHCYVSDFCRCKSGEWPRALIKQAKEHDCIPVDDVKEAAAER